MVKIDPRKKTAVVAIGQMQWDVKIDELIPQMIRSPEVPEPGPGRPRPLAPKPGAPEDFVDEP